MSDKWINHYVELEVPTYFEYTDKAEWDSEFRTFLLPIRAGEDVDKAVEMFALGFGPNTRVVEHGLLEGAYRQPQEICTF